MIKIVKRMLSVIMSAAILSSCFSVANVSAAEIDYWEISYRDATGSVTTDNEIYYSGGSSLKIVNDTPRSSNKYIMLTSKVIVEKGKKYRIKGMFKSDGCDVAAVMVDWASRWSVADFSKRFDWTPYEYTYTADASKTATLQILCEGTTTGLWVDDFAFIDTQTGENLLKSVIAGEASSIRMDDNSALEEIFDRIRTSDSFSASDIEQVTGGFKYIPTYKANGIFIDGNIDDWADYPTVYMPTLSSQYQVYIKDARDKDVKACCKFAYDEENLYIMLDVTDDEFVSYSGSAQYWQGDSIQMALSGLGESYGSELGYAHNSDTGAPEIYAEADRESTSSGKLQLSTVHEDTKTIYEIAIPWTYKFSERPEMVLFNVLANDNDGSGRRYCAELAPGISEGKTNAKFPRLEMLDDKKDWYAWVQGTREVFTDTEYEYEYYIVNKGEEKTFTVKNIKSGETEKITVPKGRGIRRTMPYVFDTTDETAVSLEISDGENTHIAEEPVKVEKKLPSEDQTREIIRVMREQDAELQRLISLCEEKNIPTHYETITQQIIGKFDEFLEDDIAHEDYTRVEYTERVTTDMYNRAREALQAYLSGEKEAKDVPVYVTSELDIDGQTIWADMEVGGAIERRPAYFIGYGHGYTVKDYVPVFQDWGVNSIQVECGPSHSMTVGDVPHWNQTYNDGQKVGTMELCTDTAYEGKNSLKFTFSDVPKANIYLSVGQEVAAEAGKTYELSGYIKANNATRVRLELSDDGYTAKNMVNGTYDWTEFKVRYTVPEGKRRATARILVDGTTDAVYFDKLSLCEVGKAENLLLNGNFEEEPNDVGVYFNRNSPLFVSTVKTLAEAEEHNISVSVLISPHYMLNTIINRFDAGYRDRAFFKFNVQETRIRPVLEHYVKEFVSEIIKYKSVNSICITNEPQFRTVYLPDFFSDSYHAWLSERYDGNIAALNEAYRTDYSDFSEIPMDVDFDTTEGQIPAKWYDYKKYNDEQLGEFHRWLAGIVKEAAPDKPITAKVQGYLQAQQTMNYLAIGTSYENFYEYLDLNGCDTWEHEETPDKLKKEMWYDYMTSFKNAPVADTEGHPLKNRGTDFRDEVHQFVAQEMWQGVVHGAAIIDNWNWDRVYNKLSDNWLLELYRPDLIEYVGTACLDLNRLAYEIRALQQEEREIGILYSDVSAINDERAIHSVYEAYEALNFNGKRVLFVTETQLEKMMDCKLIIVPFMPYATADTLPMLKKYIDNGGKVVIMGEESLQKNERDLPQDKQLTDYIFANSTVIPYEGTVDAMTAPALSGFQESIRNALKEEKLFYISVRDAESGEYTGDVEYNVGVYNGDILVNLVNYGEPKAVKVFVGNTEVTEAVELRSGNSISGAVELKQYVPVLLKISGSNKFLDTIGHWAEADIVSLAGKGIVSGMTESRFAPDAELTRAQFLALLTRSLGLSSEYQGNIPDVAAGSWYAGNAAAAIAAGIIESGVDFRPEAPITREEMCDMLVKCYESQNGALLDYDEAMFTDGSQIGDKIAVSKAVDLGLIYGYTDGSFAPKNGASRAEAVAVIERFLK